MTFFQLLKERFDMFLTDNMNFIIMVYGFYLLKYILVFSVDQLSLSLPIGYNLGMKCHSKARVD